MGQAGCLHAGNDDRRIAPDTEAVALVILFPAQKDKWPINIQQ